MDLIEFQDLPNTDTPINAENLNYNFSHIVESGSNENGSWTKWTDGTMICRMSRVFNLDFSKQWGSMYELSSRINLGNFPIDFSGLPTLSVTVVDGVAVVESINERTSSNIGNINLMRPVSNTSVDLTLHITAIGKWK